MKNHINRSFYSQRKISRLKFVAAILIMFLVGVILVPIEASLNEGKMAMANGPLDEVKVTIDNKQIRFSEELGHPFIDENGRTLVPLRAVMEAFGAKVGWDNDIRAAILEKDEIKIYVPVDQYYIIKNDVQIGSDTCAVIGSDERTYIPIRTVVEAFGAAIGWDNDNRTVVITSDGSNPQKDMVVSSKKEKREMWISYLEFAEMPKEKDAFISQVNRMFDDCVKWGMNSVIVQVRPDGDAMYPSAYFPWSKFSSGQQGKDPGYDPMALMIEAAHSRGLEFHAWINPYRVTGYLMSWNELSADNPAKQWLADKDKTNDRWVLFLDKICYYNPSIPQVRQRIVNGVKEIVSNYNVDGIHFDDYFYPTLDNNDPNRWFDKPEHDAMAPDIDIVRWRRNNINELVREVYSTIKSIKPHVVFGISPAGNVDYLRSDNTSFVDIDTWMTQPGYIDYIMPQLYWGFERKDSTGALASYAYENNLKTWVDLKKKGNVELRIGYNVANAGTNVADGNSTSEWLRYDDILKRQIQMARATGEVTGFAFFRYDIFSLPSSKNEINNLIPLIKSE